MSITETQYKQHPPTEPLDKIGFNGRIGLIALATDVTIETDLRRMLPTGMDIFTNRVQNCNPTTIENLRAMAPDISRAAGGILPGDSLDSLIYACTSGTVVIGETEVIQKLQTGRGKLPCTTPVTAVMAALNILGIRRISILTPYIESVNRELVAFFQGRGIEVLNIHGFGIESDADISSVSPDSIFSAALDACREDADSLFISCTALRSAQIIDRIETEINKPVIGSNQALMWHTLKLLQRPYQVSGFGSLFTH